MPRGLRITPLPPSRLHDALAILPSKHAESFRADFTRSDSWLLTAAAFSGKHLVALARASVVRRNDAPFVTLHETSFRRSHRLAAWMTTYRVLASVRDDPTLKRSVVNIEQDGQLALSVAQQKGLARVGFELDSDSQTLGPTGPPRTPKSLSSWLRQSINDGPFVVGLIDNAAHWTSLQPYWDYLLKRSSNPSGLQCYCYQAAWWAHLRQDARLRIVVVLRDELPVAILPMQLRCFRATRHTVVEFLGGLREADKPTMLGADKDALAAAARYAASELSAGSVVLSRQRSDASDYQELKAKLSEARVWSTEKRDLGAAVVDVDSSWEQYLKGRSRVFRKSINRKLKKLQRMPFDVELSCGNSSSKLAMFLDVEGRSWKPLAGVGVGMTPAHVAFYRSALTSLGDNVRYAELKIGGKTVAAALGFVLFDTFYSLHIAHDQAYDDYSPGFLLTYFELKDAFERRWCRRYDFLVGFGANKESWATRTYETNLFQAHATSPVGVAAWGVDKSRSLIAELCKSEVVKGFGETRYGLRLLHSWKALGRALTAMCERRGLTSPRRSRPR